MNARDLVKARLGDLPTPADSDASKQDWDRDLVKILEEITVFAKLGYICFLYRAILRITCWKLEEQEPDRTGMITLPK